MTRSPDGKTGVLTWQIVSAKNENEAWAAQPEAGHPPLPDVDVSHPFDGSLKCRTAVMNKGSKQDWTCTGNYGVPPAGTWNNNTANSSGATKATPSISMSIGRISEPSDRDHNGKAIVNAAGDVISGQTTDVTVFSIAYTRTVTIWQFGILSAMFGSVNSRAVNIRGGAGQRDIRIDAGDLLYQNTMPAGSYSPGANTIDVVDNFEYRNEWQYGTGVPKKMTDPHQIYFVNKGRHGWATFNGKQIKGEFAYDKQAPIGEEVLLKDDGTPFDDKLMVVSGVYPNEWKKPEKPTKAPEIKVDEVRSIKANFVVLKYVRYGTLDLNLVFNS